MLTTALALAGAAGLCLLFASTRLIGVLILAALVALILCFFPLASLLILVIAGAFFIFFTNH